MALLGPSPKILLVQGEKRGGEVAHTGDLIQYAPSLPDPPPLVASQLPVTPSPHPVLLSPTPSHLAYLLWGVASDLGMHMGRLKPSHQHSGGFALLCWLLESFSHG